jgi:hypothetical protein
VFAATSAALDEDHTVKTVWQAMRARKLPLNSPNVMLDGQEERKQRRAEYRTSNGRT